jgi:hypothetical protein
VWYLSSPTSGSGASRSSSEVAARRVTRGVGNSSAGEGKRSGGGGNSLSRASVKLETQGSNAPSVLKDSKSPMV